jgi:WXXGXW repeat (2 copies)
MHRSFGFDVIFTAQIVTPNRASTPGVVLPGRITIFEPVIQNLNRACPRRLALSLFGHGPDVAEIQRMKRWVAARFVAAFLFIGIGGSVANAQTSVSVGIQIGPPPPPRVVYVAPPPPQPEYVWIEGYWYPVKRHYMWHDGYWTRPPYPGAHWIAARYDGRLFFEGYWEGSRGRYAHDHRWDRDRDRDFRGKRDYARRRGDENEQ